MRAEDCFAEAQSLLAGRQVVSAIASFGSAEDLGYPAHECAAGRWKCWMLLGEFENAWRESDFIARHGPADSNCLWDGTSWAGKRLMIRCLHGLGDAVQFIRYARLLRQTSCSVMTQSHPELVRLLANVPGVDEAVSWDFPNNEKRVDWDVQMEVTELPRIFRTTLSGIPSTCPYISVPAERQLWASELIASRRNKAKVGIVWQASSFDNSRSVDLAAFERILSLKGVDFFSLQKDVPYEFPKLVDIALHSTDVLDTAALIMQMDLIISVDTMVAHLAGALGKSVWMLLPFAADWRWMMGRASSPWYPSARLFRQRNQGDWNDPLKDMERHLKSAVSSGSLSRFLSQTL